jgi:2-C-methyl-D-erythritol 2,4-cyclodiphosphate synthase
MNDSPNSTPPFAIGFGYDVHRFCEGRDLILGGVHIPAPFGLEGHSDADVLLHALADAILGAIGENDIGHFFPNDDPVCKGMDSSLIVRRALQEAESRGWQLGNADITLIAEKPRLAPHIAAIRDNVQAILQVPAGRVGVKVTTHEKLGDLGKGLGMAAHSVVLLYR